MSLQSLIDGGVAASGPLRLAATDIAGYLRLDQCERYLRLQMQMRNVGNAFLTDADVAPQPLPSLLTGSGAEFEANVRADSDQLELPWAAIAKLGIGESDAIATAHAGNLLIATNVCGAGDSDDECFAARQQAMDEGFHMLKDDFPAPVEDREYWLDFPDGSPVRCNPVTAPPECTAEGLEAL